MKVTFIITSAPGLGVNCDNAMGRVEIHLSPFPCLTFQLTFLEMLSFAFRVYSNRTSRTSRPLEPALTPTEPMVIPCQITMLAQAAANASRPPIYAAVPFCMRMGFALEFTYGFEFIDIRVTDFEDSRPMPRNLFNRGRVTIVTRYRELSYVQFIDACFWETGTFNATVRYKHYLSADPDGVEPFIGEVVQTITVLEKPEKEGQASGNPGDGVHED